MYAQIVCFDGPRSAELTAAADRAGRERVTPAVRAPRLMIGALVRVHLDVVLSVP